MGAGASAFHENEEMPRFFCHGCSRVVNLLDEDATTPSMQCPICESAFLEQLPRHSRLPGADRREDHRVGGGAASSSELSEDQSRRLANAAFMLRVLESRLRDELELLQRATADHAESSDPPKSPKLTLAQISKLKTPQLTTDLCCAQPSCPLCMEEYMVDETGLTQLPCSHVYHTRCVMQWLDMKNSCPICREVISSDIPTVIEMETRFSEDELSKKILVAKKALEEDDEEGPSSSSSSSSSSSTSVAAAGGGQHRESGDISGVVRSTLASRLAGAGSIHEEKEEMSPAATISPACRGSSKSEVSDDAAASAMIGAKSPSKRELAAELVGIVKAVEDKKAELTRQRAPLFSPLRSFEAAEHTSHSPSRPRGMMTAMAGGPIPIGLLPRGMMTIASPIQSRPAPLHSYSNPFHSQRFVSASGPGPGPGLEFAAGGADVASMRNSDILSQLRALNAALESSDDDTLPDSIRPLRLQGAADAASSSLFYDESSDAEA